MSEWNSRHTLSHWFCFSGSLRVLNSIGLKCWASAVNTKIFVLVDKCVDCRRLLFLSVWQFVMKKSPSLKHHQPRSLKRSNSDCLLWTTEKHCTYSTIRTLWIRRQQRGAWWEISTAFKVSKKLKHSSSTRISVKCEQYNKGFSWDYSGFRENSNPFLTMNSIMQL